MIVSECKKRDRKLNNKGPATIYSALSDQDRDDVSKKVSKIVEEIDGAPKTIAWRMRARVGPRKKWYTDVEDAQ